MVTPLSRRQALLAWAEERDDRFIIEDDYDSEFRFHSRPLAAMQSLDTSGKVIYMNTFSKTLAPSIRISYMILPPALMARFQESLGFYSCTVPSFEQYTLARFLAEGYFEKHINRMRKFYKARRNRLLSVVAASPLGKHLTILEENAGLHFLLQVDTPLSDNDLVRRCEKAGIRIRSLSSYYHDGSASQDTHCLVANYSGLDETALSALESILKEGF